MIKKVINLKDFIDYVNKNFVYKVFCDFDFKKYGSLKYEIKMMRYFVRLQKFEYIYEQLVISLLKFFLFIKRVCFF